VLELTRLRIDTLRVTAMASRDVALNDLRQHHADKEVKLGNAKFRQLLAHAVDQNIFTAEKVAELAGVDRGSVSRWINGRAAPSLIEQQHILKAIADRAESMAEAEESALAGSSKPV
jgi:transcriptional regulator with XRE-family HTH domain